MSITGIESTSTMSMQDIKQLMQDSNVNSMDLLSEIGADDGSLEDMLMAEFDTDGDGELSEEEAAALQEKLESMRDFMAQMLEQMMQGQEDSSSAAAETAGADSASESGSLGSALSDALSGTNTTDEADANGDGVVTADELADFLGVDVEDLNPILSAAQGSESESTGEETGIGRDAIFKAIQAYVQNIQDGLSDTALDSTSGGVNAIA